MIEVLSTVLPLIIYLLLAIVLIIIIIIGFRIIKMLDLINSVIEDLETKLASVNKLFDICSETYYKLTDITGLATRVITKFIERKEED